MTVQPPAATDADLRTAARFHAALADATAPASASAVVVLMLVSLHRSDRVASVLDDAAAQAVTAELVARVRGMLRAADRFVLVDADELWLMLPGLRSAALATLAVNRLLAVLEPAFLVEGRTVFMRPSIGVACAPQNVVAHAGAGATARASASAAESASASSAALAAAAAAGLLRAADQAQQAARASNLPSFISEVGRDGASMPDDIEAAVKRVLATNALTVAYQPKVDLATGRVRSVEALVRWPQHDTHMVPTVLLIETAERAGLIGALTTHVLHTVLRERAAWLQEGIDLKVWINLSAQSLALAELPEMLLQALQVWNTAPASIGLEITESGLIRDIDHTTEILFALQRAGFEMAIDDFGTGYSSLAYLRRFPISELKIDRMFVAGMTASQQDHQIVRSIIDLAHNFGLSVVAEGAEDQITVDALKALGCDLIQGYVYARPMAAEALLPWVRAFHAGMGPAPGPQDRP